MINRICYALKMGWRYRDVLRNYQKYSKYQTDTVLSLDPKQLKDLGIEVLALDFDGVLASYSEDTLEPTLSEWLQSCVGVFGSGKVLVLSNKPTESRAKLFQQLGIPFVQGMRKKPYPDGLQFILDKTQISSEKLLLIDDRLLTGILAAELIGARALWVTKPFINIPKHPIPEVFFILLRGLEQRLFHPKWKQTKKNAK